MLICQNELYINRHTVGPFKVYLALESADEVDDIVKVIDLSRDMNIYLTSNTVYPFEGQLDDELLQVAKNHGY